MICLCGCAPKETAVIYKSEEQVIQEESQVSDDVYVEKNSIYVYVCGQVYCPGVFALPEGSRVIDAIECAGGMTGEAASTYLNQAELLEDGQKVYVPTQEETEAEKPTSISDGRININTARKEELMTLSGVGESKAEAIIRYREEQGRFEQIQDIMNIEGIKEGVFDKIKDKISVE